MLNLRRNNQIGSDLLTAGIHMGKILRLPLWILWVRRDFTVFFPLIPFAYFEHYWTIRFLGNNLGRNVEVCKLFPKLENARSCNHISLGKRLRLSVSSQNAWPIFIPFQPKRFPWMGNAGRLSITLSSLSNNKMGARPIDSLFLELVFPKIGINQRFGKKFLTDTKWWINFQFSGAKFDCKWLLLALSLKVLEVLYYGNFVRVVLPFGTQSTNR